MYIGYLGDVICIANYNKLMYKDVTFLISDLYKDHLEIKIDEVMHQLFGASIFNI